jgi:hypothetical protein
MIVTTDYIIAGVIITTTIVSLCKCLKQSPQMENNIENEGELVNKLLSRRRLKGLRKYVDD